MLKKCSSPNFDPWFFLSPPIKKTFFQKSLSPVQDLSNLISAQLLPVKLNSSKQKKMVFLINEIRVFFCPNWCATKKYFLKPGSCVELNQSVIFKQNTVRELKLPLIPVAPVSILQSNDARAEIYRTWMILV